MSEYVDAVTKRGLEIHEKLGKLNFKCFVGALRWSKFYKLYRSRTSRYETPYPNDIYFYFGIKNNDVDWFINETSYQDCEYPEISYPEAVKLIEAIPEYPKDSKSHLIIEALREAKKSPT